MRNTINSFVFVVALAGYMLAGGTLEGQEQEWRFRAWKLLDGGWGDVGDAHRLVFGVGCRGLEPGTHIIDFPPLDGGFVIVVVCNERGERARFDAFEVVGTGTKGDRILERKSPVNVDVGRVSSVLIISRSALRRKASDVRD